jgi:hypothetical protein
MSTEREREVTLSRQDIEAIAMALLADECTCSSEDYGKAVDCPMHGKAS